MKILYTILSSALLCACVSDIETHSKQTATVPDTEKTVKSEWKDGAEFGGNWYYELFDARDTTDLVNVKSGSEYLKGLSVIQQYQIGKGLVIILGTLPDYDDMRKLITHACAEAGIVCNRTQGNSLLVADRKGENQNGVILVDIGGKGGIYHNNKPLNDILTGKSYTDDITVEPYRVLVLEEQAIIS